MKARDRDTKYMLEHKDEYEQLEYGNLEGPGLDEQFYAVLFNNSWSYCDTEANAKEGWIKILALNVNAKKPPIEGLTPGSMPLYTHDPYLEVINGEWLVARPTLYGEVIIFKLNPLTLDVIRKVKDV